MNTLSKKNNFIIFKNIIPKNFFTQFKDELNNSINQLIKRKKLKIEKNLSLNLKLLIIEEIDHQNIAKLYQDIKKYSSILKLEKSRKIKKILNKLSRKKKQLFTKAVRLDLSNNRKWELAWHQENSYVGDKNKFFFLWFPVLNKNDDFTGGLEIYNKFTKKNYKFKTQKIKNGQIQRKPIINLKKKYFETINLNLGDVLIFDKYLFHRSVENKSSKAKLSCVMSFYEK